MVSPKNGSSSASRDQEDGQPPGPSIHFGGEWPEEGRAAVRRAIEAVETRRPPESQERIGATWICTRVSDPPHFFLFASRQGVDGVIRARSFEELADQIRKDYRFR